MTRQIALLWGAVASGLVALSPWAPSLASVLWNCGFKSFVGFACPTCGTVRAALALSRLELGGALTHYPLPTLVWLGFLGGGFYFGVLGLAGRALPAIPNRLPGWGKLAIFVAVLSNWVYSIATGV